LKVGDSSSGLAGRVQRLQQRDRDLQELAALLLGVGEPAVELV
jgi:hypothetical protein